MCCSLAGMIAERDSQLKRMTRALEARSLALEESQAALQQSQRHPPPPPPPQLPATPVPGAHVATLAEPPTAHNIQLFHAAAEQHFKEHLHIVQALVRQTASRLRGETCRLSNAETSWLCSGRPGASSRGRPSAGSGGGCPGAAGPCAPHRR